MKQLFLIKFHVTDGFYETACQSFIWSTNSDNAIRSALLGNLHSTVGDGATWKGPMSISDLDGERELVADEAVPVAREDIPLLLKYYPEISTSHSVDFSETTPSPS